MCEPNEHACLTLECELCSLVSMDVRNIIRAAGGPSRIGKAIGKTHSAVCRWKKVPSVHVLTVASLSGISPHTIRPDVFGPESTQIAHVQTAEHRGAA